MAEPDLATQFTLANADDHVGGKLVTSGWLDIDQDLVNEFGHATYWDTWMHCDAERCAEESPFGGALLHGFHAVSLVSRFMRMSGIAPADSAGSLNYGMDRVRILQPVVIGNGIRLRDHISLLGVERKSAGVVLKTAHEIECEHLSSNVAYVEYLSLWLPPVSAGAQ